MTTFFSYETLTWPEVKALSRHTPCIIPLGSGYQKSLVAEMLGSPERIGILPAVPFGWKNSLLEVSSPVLSLLLANLARSLRDDGFSQVFILAPQGLNLNLDSLQLTLPCDPCSRYPSSMLDETKNRQKVVVIPIGHTEQHGYHLPLSTDTLIIEAVGEQTASTRPDLAISLPVFPYGVSTHRASFAGTLNCGGRAFEDFWLAAIRTLVMKGFSRFYLLSGHGGSCSFLVNVIKYAGENYPHIFCATAWLYLSGPEGAAALESHRQSGQGGMGHACELETSLILKLRPDLVHMDRVVDEIDFITTPSYFMDWVEGGALIANPPWEDDTLTGAYGAGSLGTAEKGEKWLEAAVLEKVSHVQEIHTQASLRSERRQARPSQPLSSQEDRL